MTRYVASQTFAGAFDMGMKTAGFELVNKVELGKVGFGTQNLENNRHILDSGWTAEAGSWEDWTPHDVPVVVGNPPCSGFSLRSAAHFRGVNSPINSCMWAFVAYAAKCDPEIVVMESVQAAFWNGRELMLALRDDLEKRTGNPWHITHVMHDAFHCGNVAIRKRYFMVLTREPFYLAPDGPRAAGPATLEECIGDLVDQPITWDDCPYVAPGPVRVRRPDGHVDGHDMRIPPYGQRVVDLANEYAWEEGQYTARVATNYLLEHGKFPPSLAIHADKVLAAPLQDNGELSGFGLNQAIRWRWQTPARVITGGSPGTVLHPRRNRLLTTREIARIMGYPDDWRIDEKQNPAWWGKQVTVDAGRWAGEQIAAHLARTVDTGPADQKDRIEMPGEREVLYERSRTPGFDSKKFERIFG
ncbi:MAG TPA: DNA cytosine methyltransferase [Rhodoglobus sp.]|nr:DNA cytosine methyltransferase [Rhodoglobus sp.]